MNLLLRSVVGENVIQPHTLKIQMAILLMLLSINYYSHCLTII